MFKHHAEAAYPPKKVEQHLGNAPGADEAPLKAGLSGAGDLRSLIEKNLKWSQIIYEQNRKINRKLWWSAAGSWLHALVILIPLIIGTILLLPFIRDAYARYNCLARGQGCAARSASSSAGSLNELIKLLPLDSAQREQLKSMLK